MNEETYLFTDDDDTSALKAGASALQAQADRIIINADRAHQQAVEHAELLRKRARRLGEIWRRTV